METFYESRAPHVCLYGAIKPAGGVDDPRLEREPVVELDPHLQAKFSMQSGETAAIAFALKHSGSLLLTDDAAARRACESVGLAAVGTIGLILEAARSKRVSVDEALRALE